MLKLLLCSISVALATSLPARGCRRGDPLDLVLVVDVTGSFAATSIDLAASALKDLDVHPDHVRVAVVRFAKYAEPLVPLNSGLSAAQIAELREAGSQKSFGLTRVGPAFRRVLDVELRAEKGLRGGSVPALVALVSDGVFVDHVHAEGVPKELAERAVDFWAFGAGQHALVGDMGRYANQVIAPEKVEGDGRRLVEALAPYARSTDCAKAQLSPKLSRATATERLRTKAGCGPMANFGKVFILFGVFVWDRSLSTEAYEGKAKAISALFGDTGAVRTVLEAGIDAQFGVRQFARSSETLIALGDGLSPVEMEERMEAEGPMAVGLSMLGAAVEKVLDEDLSAESGARASAAKAVVLLTDGGLTDERPTAAISEFARRGVKVLALCIGESLCEEGSEAWTKEEMAAYTGSVGRTFFDSARLGAALAAVPCDPTN